MLELSRTVRFCLNAAKASEEGGGHEEGQYAQLTTPRHNTYSAWPAMRGLGRYYELRVRCRGEADPRTGYFLNIKHIDEAVRGHVLPRFAARVADEYDAATTPMGVLMRDIFNHLHQPLGGSVVAVALKLTPRFSLTLRSHDMGRVTIKQQYEFSAAHRLHVPALSDARNREIFGKCNNPAGHGHNYRLEVAVSAVMDDAGDIPQVERLDAVVDQHVIRLLDHKHLNLDVDAFAELNPSVENIARVIWDMLAPHIAAVGSGAAVRLEAVSVWETEKTVCTYRGSDT